MSYKSKDERFKEILGMTRDKPMTMHDIADAMGGVLQNAEKYIRMLRAENRIHIESYTVVKMEHDVQRAEYRAGIGQDAVRPAKLTNSQKAKKYRAKLKQKVPDFPCRRMRGPVSIRRDNLVAAFFG